MGQAKLRRSLPPRVVYHHTSTLRTNLLWMSGEIKLEGQGDDAFHPAIGRVKQNATLRRAMMDFPPLVWFTTQIQVPKVLMDSEIHVLDSNGQRRSVSLERDIVNAIALNRVALGFRIDDIPVVPWQEHAGYHTAEGRELNESARASGDNPEHWYVSETPIDLMLVTEFWSSWSISQPKMERRDAYVADIKRMVTMCRERPGVGIAPSWLTPEKARKLGAHLGVPVHELTSGA